MNRFIHPDFLLEIVGQEQADLRAYYDVSSQLKTIKDRSPDQSIRMWLGINEVLVRVKRWIKIKPFGTNCRGSEDQVVACGLNPCS